MLAQLQVGVKQAIGRGRNDLTCACSPSGNADAPRCAARKMATERSLCLERRTESFVLWLLSSSRRWVRVSSAQQVEACAELDG